MADMLIERGTMAVEDFRLIRQKPFRVSASRNIRVPLVVPVGIGETYHVYQDARGNMLFVRDV